MYFSCVQLCDTRVRFGLADPNLRVAALSVFSALAASSCPPEEMYAVLEGRFGGSVTPASAQPQPQPQRVPTTPTRSTASATAAVQSQATPVARSYAAAATATTPVTSASTSTPTRNPSAIASTGAAAAAALSSETGPARENLSTRSSDDNDDDEAADDGFGGGVGDARDSASVASSLVSRSSVRAVAPSAPRSALLAALSNSNARLVCIS